MADKKRATKADTEDAPIQYCGVPVLPPRPLNPGLDPLRMELIRVTDKKWVNGTTLHYCFLDRPARFKGADAQKEAVRKAWKKWKSLGIGLIFEEVTDPRDAEIRIAFESGAGSWSYVGRDNLRRGDPTTATMNFGWDLTTPNGFDTALHEIGHALGFSHEHQNPNAGIVWDEAAVIADLGGPPNNWDEAKTRHNILNKLTPNAVDGSNWDPNSIMHYPFKAGLIVNPRKYRNKPLEPDPGLSRQDIKTVKAFYPPLTRTLPVLQPYLSQPISIEPGEQLDFHIKPTRSRRYTIQTFGALDTVVVLFEDRDGDDRYVAGDDDSGEDRNALIEQRLSRGDTYTLRIRLYHSDAVGEGSVMVW